MAVAACRDVLTRVLRLSLVSVRRRWDPISHVCRGEPWGVVSRGPGSFSILIESVDSGKVRERVGSAWLGSNRKWGTEQRVRTCFLFD